MGLFRLRCCTFKCLQIFLGFMFFLMITSLYSIETIIEDMVRQAKIQQLEILFNTSIEPANHPIHDHVIKERATTKVLLVTYHRGGSTFLGESFDKNPKTFYWFEPLRGHTAEFLNGHPEYYKHREEAFLEYKNGTVRHYPENVVEQQMENVVNILNCRFHELSKLVLREYMAMDFIKSSKLMPFHECLARNKTSKVKKFDIKTATYTDLEIDKCLPLAINACETTNIRALKTIRVALHMVPILLQKDPNIKIIHYVRDPRGILSSHISMWPELKNSANAQRWAKLKCTRLSEDYQWISSLQQSGAKILPMHYEDLAVSYNETLHKIYSFIDKPMDPSLVKWFQLNSHAKNDNGKMGTVRKDSKATANKWKKTLPKNVKVIVDKICNKTLQSYGYI